MTGVQTCALPISAHHVREVPAEGRSQVRLQQQQSLSRMMHRLDSASRNSVSGSLLVGLIGLLAYPAVVLALATTVMTAIMVWVIPTFETLYLNMQATLPWPTRWLLLTRQLVMNGGVWMGVAVPLLSVAMAWGLRQPPWPLRLDARALAVTRR